MLNKNAVISIELILSEAVALSLSYKRLDSCILYSSKILFCRIIYMEYVIIVVV